MQGVVSLLDDTHQAMIEHIQSRLDRVLGAPGLCRTPIAHFSYHVADAYDPEILVGTLLSFAASNVRFQVRTTGLGLFTGRRTVLYIPIVRSPVLNMQHHVLWRQLSLAAVNPSLHYHPARWVPHITLADREDLPGYLPDITRLLSPLEFAWEIEITNIALLYGDGEALEIGFRHELSMEAEPG